MHAPALSILRCGLAAAVLACGANASAQSPAAAATRTTSERNVYAAGGEVRPAGPVAGDFTAAGGKIVVDQPVGGDAMVAGGSVDVRAAVAEDVRAAGGDVSIEGGVGGELFATGGNITVTRAASVAHGARLWGSRIAMDGRIEGELRATGAKVIIDGEVGGSARVVAGEIELGPRAKIGGAFTYVSRSELKKAEGATIAGALTREPEEGARPGERRGWERSFRGPPWMGGVMGFAGLLATAALLLLLAPRFGEAAARRVRSSPWLALVIGFGTIVALPVLAVLLFITILGIPLGIAVLALYPALLLGGFVVGVLFVARQLAAALRKAEPRRFGPTIAWFALALLLVGIVAGVPFLGGLLGVFLSVAGAGAIVLELHGRRMGPPAAAPAGAPMLSQAPGGG